VCGVVEICDKNMPIIVATSVGKEMPAVKEFIDVKAT
jgi:hypothetical protein